jgi:hypothetical protein
MSGSSSTPRRMCLPSLFFRISGYVRVLHTGPEIEARARGDDKEREPRAQNQLTALNSPIGPL